MTVTNPREMGAAGEKATPSDRFWYKDAIFYELHVKAYSDSNFDFEYVKFVRE